MQHKKLQKTFFLIPGLGMPMNSKPFFWLVDFLEKKGIRVIKTPVRWNYRTLSQNTEEFIQFFEKRKGNENYILGFSYGAVIAFLSANMVKPKKIFLCSLSSAFAEDQKHLTPFIRKYLGKRRCADEKTRSGKVFARTLQVPSMVFYGTEEGKRFPALKKRCEETAKLAKNSKLVIVKDAPHQIDFPAYVSTLKKELSLI